jgi:hypothetical protein
MKQARNSCSRKAGSPAGSARAVGAANVLAPELAGGALGFA